jgi:formylglycine-generating enzyme required for sulfatase activity
MASDQRALGDPIVNRVGMVLVPIPAGEFPMGTADKKGSRDRADRKRKADPESPQHLVKITQPYYLSSCEVTQQQYEKVMGTSPWKGKPLVREGPSHAASYVTWDDAVEFCRKLSEQEDQEYRLPTEAEWEYACRAGTETTWSFGDNHEQLSDYAWYDANAYQDGQQYAHRVGRKLPNAWGLYDMHGNVWEWCQDWYAPYDGKRTESVDPAGPERGRHRVWRGGSFASALQNTRSATRLSHGREDYHPEYLAGLRVVRNFKAK